MTLEELVHLVPPERRKNLIDAAHQEGLPDMRRIDEAVEAERLRPVGPAKARSA